MRTVRKYNLTMTTGPQTVRMTVGAKFLAFSLQHGAPRMWFECNSDATSHERKFMIVGTGHDIPVSARYMSTTFADEQFVWHLYEL